LKLFGFLSRFLPQLQSQNLSEFPVFFGYLVHCEWLFFDWLDRLVVYWKAWSIEVLDHASQTGLLSFYLIAGQLQVFIVSGRLHWRAFWRNIQCTERELSIHWRFLFFFSSGALLDGNFLL